MQTKHPFGAPSYSTLEELRVLLKEGEESGDAIEMTPQEWERLRNQIEHDSLLRRKAS